jgi:HK97 family phage major capsid protein
MFHDDSLKLIRKLKDSQNNYIWTAGSIQTGAPDLLLGKSYVINQDMATPAANAKAVLYGDFSKFIIRDVMQVEVFRLNELYIRNGQIGFIAFARSGSVLVDAGTKPVRGHQLAQAES